MFAFSQIDPRTNGQVTDMEVPLSRYLGAAAAEGQNDSMFNSVRQWREMSLESSDPAGKILQPEEANKTYGLPGLKWDRPVKENVASLMNTRHQAALDRAYFLSQDNHTLVAGALGMGTQMMSAMMNPLDLGAMFIPFVGEAKTANVLGRGALRTAIARGLISHEAFSEAIPRGTELARSVVQGGAYMGMAQTPIIANRMAEGGPGPGLQDLESIGMGSLFAAGMHLGIGGAARAFKFLDPGTREATFEKAMDDFAKGQDADVADIAKVGMEQEKIRSVAFKDPETGHIFEGQMGDIHPTLFDREKLDRFDRPSTEEELHVIDSGKNVPVETGSKLIAGFMTNHGNFLDREEAANLIGVQGPLDSIKMSGTDEVNFGTSTRLAKAGDVEGLTKYLIAHGAPGDAAAREYALAWIEKERTKDPTKLNAIQARENGFAKQEGKILSQPVIEEKQGHSPTPEDAEISQVKEDAAELRRQLEEAAKESGMEVGEPQIKTNEKIVAAAVKSPSGKVHVGEPGQVHASIMDDIEATEPSEKGNHDFGFMTNTGRYVNRDEAASIMGHPGVVIAAEDFTKKGKLNARFFREVAETDSLAFVKQKGKLGKQGFYTIKDPRVSGFSMQVEPDKITLVNLSVAEKGKGLGGEIIERVKKLADEQEKPVELIAHPDSPDVQAKLDSFYKKHGFTEGENRTWRYEPESSHIISFTSTQKNSEPLTYFVSENTLKGQRVQDVIDITTDPIALDNFAKTINEGLWRVTMVEDDIPIGHISFGDKYDAMRYLNDKMLEHKEQGHKISNLNKRSDIVENFKPATDSIKAAADCLKKKIL